jgi:hypothetical protein
VALSKNCVLKTAGLCQLDGCILQNEIPKNHSEFCVLAAWHFLDEKFTPW